MKKTTRIRISTLLLLLLLAPLIHFLTSAQADTTYEFYRTCANCKLHVVFWFHPEPVEVGEDYTVSFGAYSEEVKEDLIEIEVTSIKYGFGEEDYWRTFSCIDGTYDRYLHFEDDGFSRQLVGNAYQILFEYIPEGQTHEGYFYFRILGVERNKSGDYGIDWVEECSVPVYKPISLTTYLVYGLAGLLAIGLPLVYFLARRKR